MTGGRATETAQSPQSAEAGSQEQTQSSSVHAANQKSAQAQIEQHTSGVADDEQILVLEASTSTSKVTGLDLFEANRAYSASINQVFFNRLAAPTGKGFLDMVTPAEPAKADELTIGEQALKGTKQQTAIFEVTSTNTPDPMVRRPTSNVAFHGSGNGMLNLARLASAYISAVKGGAIAKNPAKLKIICHVTMGNAVGAKDEDARKETYLTTVPPSFNPAANGTVNAIMTGVLGAYGFLGDIDKSELSLPPFSNAAGGSTLALAQMAERLCNSMWRDSPTRRTFLTSPLAGVSDSIMASVAGAAPKAFAGAEGQPAKTDATPMSVRREAFYGKRPVGNPGAREDLLRLDPAIKAKVFADGKALVEIVKGQLLGSLASGIERELPKGLEQYAPVMAERWSQAIEAAFAQVRWDMWYASHFITHQYGQAAPSKSVVTANVVGNVEGIVHNEEQLARRETPGE